jgi:hypothetical protein
MRALIWVSLMTLGLGSVVHSAPLQKFIHSGVSEGACWLVSPNGKNESLPALGVNLGSGIRFRQWDAHIDCQHLFAWTKSFMHNNTHGIEPKVIHVNSDQVALGVRRFFGRNQPHSKEEFLGVGWSYGWLIRHVAGKYVGTSMHQSSKGSFGWLAECGMIFHTSNRLSYMMILQYRNAWARLPDSTYYESVSNTPMLTLAFNVMFSTDR